MIREYALKSATEPKKLGGALEGVCEDYEPKGSVKHHFWQSWRFLKDRKGSVNIYVGAMTLLILCFVAYIFLGLFIPEVAYAVRTAIADLAQAIHGR